MDMPPLTPPDKPLNPVFWRILLLSACVLVFSFALHAKVAVYGQAHPHPSTASKLWADSSKFETPEVAQFPLLLWLAVLLSAVFCWEPSGRYSEVPVIARERSQEQYLHRFLRPPPSR